MRGPSRGIIKCINKTESTDPSVGNDRSLSRSHVQDFLTEESVDLQEDIVLCFQSCFVVFELHSLELVKEIISVQ